MLFGTHPPNLGYQGVPDLDPHLHTSASHRRSASTVAWARQQNSGCWLPTHFGSCLLGGGSPSWGASLPFACPEKPGSVMGNSPVCSATCGALRSSWHTAAFLPTSLSPGSQVSTAFLAGAVIVPSSIPSLWGSSGPRVSPGCRLGVCCQHPPTPLLWVDMEPGARSDCSLS